MPSSWGISNKIVQSLYINNKEVASIVRNSDNSVLYQKPSSISVPVPNSMSVTSSSDIISYYHAEDCTISATVLDSNNQVCSNENVSFTFKHGNTILDTDFTTTDSNGVATSTYTASGVGDVIVEISCGNVNETYTMEDCIFFKADEISKKTGSSMIKGNFYDNISLSLPNHFEWSVDMKVSSNSGSEDRVFLTCTDFSGEQPPNALWLQIASSGASRGGSRRSGSTYNSSSSVSLTANTFGNLKAERNGDTIAYSVNGTSVGSLTETWIDNYNSWWFSYSYWKRSNITGTIRNMKVKAL